TWAGRLAELFAQLLHFAPETRPVAAFERRQGAIVVRARACEVGLHAGRRRAIWRGGRGDGLYGFRLRDGRLLDLVGQGEERVKRAAEVVAHYDSIAVRRDHALQLGHWPFCARMYSG